jgi:N utilization substance protein B
MMLCECDQNPPDDIDAALASFWMMLEEIERDHVEAKKYGVKPVLTRRGTRHLASLAEMKAFAEERVRGVMSGMQAIDGALEPFLENWAMYRLGTVERSVLRLGAWELSNCPDIPVPIAINEAVDLAKFFSETQSGKFVNGVLDRFAKSLPPRPPSPKLG